MDDTIYRQAAILQLSHNKCGNEEWDIAVQHDIEIITQLPSAQPDLSEYSDKLWRSAYERGKRDAQPEIIKCKDCKRYDGRPCGIVDWYNTADDFCSRAERLEK